MSGTIRDFMTTPVVTVRQNTPFKVIVSRMLAARVGAVPVIDDAGLVIGIVSAHDLLARKAGPGPPEADAAGKLAASPPAGRDDRNDSRPADDLPCGDDPG